MTTKQKKQPTHYIEIQKCLDDNWYWCLAETSNSRMVALSRPMNNKAECLCDVQRQQDGGILPHNLPIIITLTYLMVLEHRHDELRQSGAPLYSRE